MATNASQSRVRVGTGGTSQQVCVVLNKGVHHLIAQRPTVSELSGLLFAVYGTTHRIAPTITLRSGVKVKLLITDLEFRGLTDIPFKGTIANGSELVKVEGTFTGESTGSLTLVD